MRYAARRDSVESALIGFARSLGAWMIQIDQPCDWLMWYQGRWHLVEIKDPKKMGQKTEFTEAQNRFLTEAATRGAKLITWRTDADVLRTLKGRVSA